jgi:hypothetical protein
MVPYRVPPDAIGPRRQSVSDLQFCAGGTWAVGIIDEVYVNLIAAFPTMKRFARPHLWCMRARASSAIWQQPVGESPWGHNIVLW